MFEPTTLPISKLYLPLLIDAIEVKSSGSDVPKATIENPTFNSVTPIIFDIFKALSTIKFVPIERPNIDISIIKEVYKKLFGIEKLNIKRSSIPAITHVDYSARIQTVHKETNPKYYDLINEFKKITGCPVLVNTSFNVRGEPIVCSIDDAFNCFMGTNLDILVIENFILYKDEQDQSLIKDYKNKFELD
mgnify:CR=1 FL=1